MDDHITEDTHLIQSEWTSKHPDVIAAVQDVVLEQTHVALLQAAAQGVELDDCAPDVEVVVRTTVHGRKTGP